MEGGKGAPDGAHAPVNGPGGPLGLSSGDAKAAEGAAADAAAPLDPLVESALRKVGRRVVPLCTAVALLNHLDRSK